MNVPFDFTTRNFSLINAYWLGLASDIVYNAEEKAHNKVNKEMKLDFFKFIDNNDTQCMVIGNEKFTIVAFRGTETINDWKTDADVDLVDGPGGLVHEGFYTALSYVWQELLEQINKRKNLPIWFTGHSLGGALAVLAVAKLKLEHDMGFTINGLYTFGQPKVGNGDFARNCDFIFYNQMYRFVNNNDVVARLPPGKYTHSGRLMYFDSKGDLLSDKKMAKMTYWRKLWDRLKGRIQGRYHHCLSSKTDGIRDHSMKNYLNGLERKQDIK